MNILFIGDIVGRPGRQAVKKVLPGLKEQLGLDLVIANGENLAGGLGITYETYREMIDTGIDFFTSGNHIYRKDEIIPYLGDLSINIVRPANYSPNNPGRGSVVVTVNNKRVQISNMVGHAFMGGRWTDDYFKIMDELLTVPADIRIVDFHAEATSEKAIFGYSLDGQVTIFVGTHTHVPTADERILPKGTAFQSDVGMTGPLHSSLGADLQSYIAAAKLHQAPKFEVGSGPVVFNATFFAVDNPTNRVTDIRRIQQVVE